MAGQQLPYAVLYPVTPHYIILGEFGIAIILAVLAKRLANSTWADTFLIGTTGGMGIFLCYALAYGITDGLAQA